ncbi:MAG: flavin monoamine oxidase family protein [Acidimicrobiales bacterium]
MSTISRRSIIRAGAAAGLAALLAGCADLFDGDEADVKPGDQQNASGDSPKTVIVVGAGPAGMSAAALLTRAGLDVRVLEAGATYGGRIRHQLDFADFPISLGAEWLHEDPDELEAIADDPNIEVPLAAYQAADEVAYFDGRLWIEAMGDNVDSDLKFAESSWLDFFETHLLPDIKDRMEFGIEVVRVDDTGQSVVLTDTEGIEYTADRAVVTVPLKLLQEGRVEFIPPLPDTHQEAIANAEIWGGIKVFIEFDNRFYPTFIAFPDSDTDAGQRLYYDAAYGQDSNTNILGLFAVGLPAERYQAADEGDELRDIILAELDEIFDGAASANYVKHLAQNWDDEPFARAAYLADEADGRIPSQLQERFSDRVFLAGDAYTSHDDWSAVDDAARSARDAVRDILR